MLSNWIIVLLAAPALLLLQSLVSLARNYRIAKKTGLPVVVSPVNISNPVWMVLGGLVGPILLKAPLGLGAWVRCGRWGWLWEDQGALHRELGKVIINVDPKKLRVLCADVDVIRQIYANRKGFENGPEEKDILPVLMKDGISAAADVDWQRHRRILAPPFNENIMNDVWNESLRQAVALTDFWVSHGQHGIGSPACCTDLSTVALNVLAKAGYGYSWDFRVRRADQRATAEEDLSTLYCDRLTALLSSPLSAIITGTTPKWVYDHGPDYPWLLPKVLREHVVIARDFKKQVLDLVAERKAEIASGRAKEHNFLNAIIVNSEDMQRELNQRDKSLASGLAGFTPDEFYSNLVNFGIAGHETTAHTICYCLHVLAAHPELQDWVQEELDGVFPDPSVDISTLDYEETFYRLKRCRALMYETVRLYPPLVQHTKQVLGSGQQLEVDGRTIWVPPKTQVDVSTMAVHVQEEHWGPDVRVYRPSRWIRHHHQASSTTHLGPPTTPDDDVRGGGDPEPAAGRRDLDAEAFVVPVETREAFIPWSLPARDCPGKKFAQVEFVAVTSYLLRRYRVEAIPLAGELPGDTRARVMGLTRSSFVSLTLTMKAPPVERPTLRLVRRVPGVVGQA